MALMQSARRAAGPAASRFFSTASVAAGRSPVAGLPKALPPAVSSLWMVGAAAAPRRFAGTAAAGGVDVTAPTATPSAAAAKKEESEKEAASYWGVAPTRFVKEDGTVWKWSCFRQWDTYEADVSIDLTKHHDPATLGDKVARWTVKSLRWPVDLFFQGRRHGRPRRRGPPPRRQPLRLRHTLPGPRAAGGGRAARLPLIDRTDTIYRN